MDGFDMARRRKQYISRHCINICTVGGVEGGHKSGILLKVFTLLAHGRKQRRSTSTHGKSQHSILHVGINK
jgi:hypothetical protein